MFKNIYRKVAAITIVALIGSTTVQAAVQASYYVDYDNGSDNNAGTNVSFPLKTLAAAKAKVDANNNNMTGDIIVYLRGGTHYLDNLVEFKAADSGNNGFKVIYRNYANELPVLSAGTPITNWSNEGGGIWSASVPAGFTFRQLYVNGQKRIRARTPNVGSYYETLGWTSNSDRRQKVNASEISNWDNLGEVEIAEAKTFVQMRYRIDSYTVSNGTAYVVPKEPDRANMFVWSAGLPKGPGVYFFENAYEFIDSDGEWYLNTSENKVYYRPASNENLASAEVIAPKLETALKFSANASNITLFGVQVSHSTWLRPSTDGLMVSQGGFFKYYDNAVKYYGVTPAAIVVVTANNLHFERNKIKYVGGNGINFYGNTRDNVVIGNVFYETADAAIVVGAHHPAGYNYSLNNNKNTDELITNNYFHKTGSDYHSGSGVMSTSPTRIGIIHNEFNDMKVFAVNAGWGAYNSNDPMDGTQIKYNRFEKISYMGSDASAIHFRNDATSGLVQENYFLDVQRTITPTGGTAGSGTDLINGVAVYLDNDAAHNMLLNNAMDNVNIPIATWSATGSPNYDVVNPVNNPTKKQDIIDNAGIQSWYIDIKNLADSGSIGKNLEPNYEYSWMIADHRFNETSGASPLGLTTDTSGGVVDTQSGNLRLADSSGSSRVSVLREIQAQEDSLMFEFKSYAAQTNQNAYYILRDSGEIKVLFAFGSNGQLRAWDGTQAVNLASYQANTDYLVHIVADPQTDTYDVYINGVLEAQDFDFRSPATSLNEVYIHTANSGLGTQYIKGFNVKTHTTAP